MIRRGNWLILLTLLILAVLIGVLAWANAPPSGEGTTITIKKDGIVLKVWTLERISALPYREISKNIQSASQQDESGLYRGVALSLLLEQTGPGLPADGDQIITRAADGYTAAFSVDEVLLDGNIIVAYARDGQPLGDRADGGSGPFRIIIRDDAFGTRGTKFLTIIEVE